MTWPTDKQVSPVGGFNRESTLLSSATRTSNTTSDDQVNRGARGVALYLNVSDTDPQGDGGTASVTLEVEAKDPVSGTYVTLFSAGVSVGGSTGISVYVVHPEWSAAAHDVTEIENSLLPQTWRAKMVHGDSNDVEYSVGYAMLP